MICIESGIQCNAMYSNTAYTLHNPSPIIITITAATIIVIAVVVKWIEYLKKIANEKNKNNFYTLFVQRNSYSIQAEHQAALSITM